MHAIWSTLQTIKSAQFMFDNDLGQQKAGMAVMVWHMNGYNLNQRTFLYKIKSSY